MVDYNELSGIEAFANRSDVRADPTDLRLLYIETDRTAMEGEGLPVCSGKGWVRKGCPHGCAIPVTAANILHLFLGCSAGVRVCFSRACFPLGDLGQGRNKGLLLL